MTCTLFRSVTADAQILVRCVAQEQMQMSSNRWLFLISHANKVIDDVRLVYKQLAHVKVTHEF